MKAIVRDEYGSPDVLRLEDIRKPTPKSDEVLLKVLASSVSSSDWELLTGTPYYVRPLFGLRSPRRRILGSDVAGRVEAVGSDVVGFHPGDEVFGDIMWEGFGGFAEYVCVPEGAPLVRKPARMTFEEAAAIPQAAVIAVQGLRSLKDSPPRRKVLINGAGGGAGSFAVQIAKPRGAEVTGVDSARKLDMLRSLGVDHLIDYKEEDFTQNGQRYDFILDVAAHHSILDYWGALSPGGSYRVTGGRMLLTAFLGPCISALGSKSMSLLRVRPNKDDLKRVGELFEDGTVAPEIDKIFSLASVPDALRYFGEGFARGKVVIAIGTDELDPAIRPRASAR